MNQSHHLRGTLPSKSPNLSTPNNRQKTIYKMPWVWQLLSENERRTWCLARELCCSHVMPKAMCWDCEWVRKWTLTRSILATTWKWVIPQSNLRWDLSPVGTLIVALWEALKQWTQLSSAWIFHLRKMWDNKFMLWQATEFVVILLWSNR